jgi:hypothetical protein
MLYSGAYLRNGELVVLDDPSLERAMIDTRTLRSWEALQIASAVPAGPSRELLTVIQRAIDGLQEAQKFVAPLIGPQAWDELSRAAGGAEHLIDLIRQAPDETDILPSPESGHTLTVEDIEAAPPAVLDRLIHLLKDEVDDFAGGRDFNSGLSISPAGVEVRSVREMLLDQKTGRPLLQDKSVLVLDATPMMPLYERLARRLVLEPTYAPEVALPPNVSVTQVADFFFGKSSVEGWHGTEGRPSARGALLTSLAEWRRRYPGDREAAICAKSIKDDIVSAGVAEDRVLTFHGSRGLNAIEDADVLHVLGRPQAPNHAALQLAHVLHRGEDPVSPHLAMRAERYAGYRSEDGSGRAITVTDFWDPRASMLFRAYREAELLQAIHRARLFRVGSAQLDMFELDGQRIARSATDRRRVRLVLHSSHPIPGLRVDELIYGPTAGGVNEVRAIEAAERILAARDQLIAEGVAPTVSAVSRVARARHSTVARVLEGTEFDPAPGIPLISESIRGMPGAGSNSRRAASNSPPADDQEPVVAAGWGSSASPPQPLAERAVGTFRRGGSP